MRVDRPNEILGWSDLSRSENISSAGKVRSYKILLVMTPTSKTFTFAITDALKAGLQAIKNRDGISEAEQIRRAIAMWLEAKGVTPKSKRKRS